MWDNRYSLKTKWVVQASLHEVLNIIQYPDELPLWWSSVYSSVQPLEEKSGDDSHGPAPKRFLVRSRGYLPYRLVWTLTVESVHENRIAFRSDGDFSGQGRWNLKSVEDCVEMVFDWNIVAEKRL